MDKAARKLSSPKKSCFGEYFVRSLQTFWPKAALPRYAEGFLQYAKDKKRERYSCPSLLRQANTSEATISQTQRVNVSSLLMISCLLCSLGPVMRAFQFYSQVLVSPLLSVWSDLTGTDDLRESSPRYE